MGRSGYSEDCDGEAWQWMGRVAVALKGRRGQQALRDLVSGLDAMPTKRLIAESFSCDDGECSWGVVAKYRGLDVADLEPFKDSAGYVGDVDSNAAGRRFNVAPSMAAEIMWQNDEAGVGELGKDGFKDETPENRWVRMRAWAVSKLVKGD